MNVTENNNQKPRAGVKKYRKKLAGIDMTPMVDLGFLLISFFVMTTRMMEPTTMNLTMPREGKTMNVPQSGTITVLISNPGEIYMYQGSANELRSADQLIKVRASGAGSVREKLLQYKQEITTSGIDMFLIIKAAEGATYQQVIDMLDEAAISAIDSYALVSFEPEDFALIETIAKNK